MKTVKNLIQQISRIDTKEIKFTSKAIRASCIARCLARMSARRKSAYKLVKRHHQDVHVKFS